MLFVEGNDQQRFTFKRAGFQNLSYRVTPATPCLGDEAFSAVDALVSRRCHQRVRQCSHSASPSQLVEDEYLGWGWGADGQVSAASSLKTFLISATSEGLMVQAALLTS